MTTEVAEQTAESTAEENKVYTPEEVEAIVSGLKSKVEELLHEKKTVAQRAKELEEAQKQAEMQRLQEKEEFKTLWEREQQAKKELQEKFEQFSKQVQQKEVELAANGIASQLTRDTKRAELLKEQIAKYARYTDEGVKYEMGGVEVGEDKVIEHLRTEYAFLVDGSQASGGGASGTTGGGAAAKKRSEMTPAEKVAYIKQHGPEAYRKLPK